MNAIRHLRNATAFAGALALGCAGIGAALPFRDVPEVTAKLEHFRKHADEYDTIFLGTSRVYHQLVPSLFDELTARCGLKTKSFNAAIDAMRPPEINYYVSQLLKCRPSHLRFVFIENAGVHTGLDTVRRGTLRVLYWHDWRTLCLVARASLADRKVPKKKKLGQVLASYREPLDEIIPHVVLFVRNVVNLGRANILTDGLVDAPPPGPDLNALGPNGDGYLNTGRPETILPAYLEELQKGIAARRAKPAVIDYADAESQRAFDELLKSFERLGAQTVQIIPPTTGTRKFHLKPERDGGRLKLDYSDLDRYGELYEPKYRIDTDHLNDAGAHVFTKVVAEELCAAVKAKP